MRPTSKGHTVAKNRDGKMSPTADRSTVRFHRVEPVEPSWRRNIVALRRIQKVRFSLSTSDGIASISTWRSRSANSHWHVQMCARGNVSVLLSESVLVSRCVQLRCKRRLRNDRGEDWDWWCGWCRYNNEKQSDFSAESCTGSPEFFANNSCKRRVCCRCDGASPYATVCRGVDSGGRRLTRLFTARWVNAGEYRMAPRRQRPARDNQRTMLGSGNNGERSQQACTASCTEITFACVCT